MSNQNHPLFNGKPGLFNGIPEEEVRRISAFATEVLTSMLERCIDAADIASIGANQEMCDRVLGGELGVIPHRRRASANFRSSK